MLFADMIELRNEVAVIPHAESDIQRQWNSQFQLLMLAHVK